jgi:hydroxyacylglutathione hydrolase
MKVKQFRNKVLSSNSYILYLEEDNYVWVIDPGDSAPLIDWIKSKNKILKGILLTHSHADHTYGMHDLIKDFPKAKKYSSFLSIETFKSERLNGSLYMEMPFTIDSDDFIFVSEGDEVRLWDNLSVKVLETPGHNNDCLSFETGSFLFTGDALIPEKKVHTRSKYGDKSQAENTISRIVSTFSPDTVIYPGHGEICTLLECFRA